ncbi:DUF1775 domain-containing protein [Frigoribacterium sp. VKM Ac-2530]|uniref:DUF1775 domain-containing protein n=1 Tax=Frigoribacterium sp. VKM Ac-2530 TaxID=2783822 RepID=UPI00188A27DC|nr:DUF1775 domain-containing protein [Frigoribacterium sp. VKM Ac-2530]MBF4579409.1 DUF1775 domain-containing protein [Frigoribacterium sp. VKM Ac-2530]
MRPRARTTSPARTLVVGTVVASAAGLALAVATPLTAQAHVELEASSTAPAALSVLTFAVGHGCEGSPTTSLAVTFPAEVQAVTPTIKPGWSVTEVPADPSTSTGTGTGTTVTWTADPGSALPDGLRDTVAVSALLPVGGEAGDLVAFPAVQTCEVGSYDWVEVAEPGSDAEPASPAPFVTLTDADGGGAGGSTDDATGSQEALAASSAPAPVDETARALAVGALVVGVVGLVLLTTTLRRRAAEAGR